MTRRAHLRRRARRIRHGFERRGAHGSRRRRIAGLVARELERMNGGGITLDGFARFKITIEGACKTLGEISKAARAAARAFSQIKRGAPIAVLPAGTRVTFS